MTEAVAIPLLNFFESYSEAVVITDDSDAIVFVNKAFTKLTDFTYKELQGTYATTFFKTKVNYDKVQKDKATHWETNYYKKDGTFAWVKISVTKLPMEDGTMGNLYTLIDNPTLDQVRGLLKESESRFANLADASPVMIWMTDPDNLCYYFNKSWLSFTGRKFEEEVGVGWLQNVHPDDINLFGNYQSNLDAHESYTVEYRLKRSDGLFRHIHEIGTPRFLPDGSFAGYMGSCLDISDIKEVQNELANQTRELRRSNEELEQFAYVASHDLQEPLRMISSYIQLIQKNIVAGKAEGTDDFMGYVLDGVSRMQGLIADLLQFSRVNRKGNPFMKVNINEVMQIAVAHLTNRIRENGATILFDNMPTVLGDSFQLIRLFQNLVDNAIKFRSDTPPVIKISAEDRDKHWLFTVADNGIGIEDKFYNRIFVIFQRLHTRNEYEGTGIGLAVCKKIVERHGGEIWVESEHGKGSTFYFTIKK
jgi:PAS domain S-box-containing protein